MINILIYPNVLSKNIIITKPINNAWVDSFECPSWFFVSGIISLLITNSIAPAANAKAKGKIGLATCTRDTPKIPPNGSTSPVANATKKAFPDE